MSTLQVRISDLVTRIATECKALRTMINGNAADLTSLTTTNKTNLVAAINEVKAAIGGAGASINDTGTSTLSVWSSDKTNTSIGAAITALVNGAPANLDTLLEIAAAINNDPSYYTTVNTALGLKAPLASPTFTGVPAVPTATAGTSTTQIASTAFVAAAVASLVNTAPTTLDTLNEIAAALGNDPSFATTITTALGNRVRFDAAQTLTAGQITQICANIGVGEPDTNFVTTFNAGLV